MLIQRDHIILAACTSVLLVPSLLSLESCSLARTIAMADYPRVVEWELGLLNDSHRAGLTKSGNPRTVDCPYGKAVQFDGVGDGMFLEDNPLLNLRQFTVEVIFRPDPDGPPEQRFLQMGEINGDRMMIETRVTPDRMWYLDAYIKSGDSSHAVIDKNRTHSTAEWHHVAFVFDNGTMETYVDGIHELEGYVPFSPFNKGTTSIGVRMNKVYWFKGAICRIRVTPKCLNPSDFKKS